MIISAISYIFQNNSIFLILLSTVIVLINIYYYHVFSYWKKRGVTFMKPVLFFGNLRPFILRKKCLGENFTQIYKHLKTKRVKYGGFYVLGEPTLMILDPELIKTICIKNFSSFPERGYHYDSEVDPLGANLVTLSNPRWHQLRTIFSPTFSAAKIKMIFPTFSKCGEQLVSTIHEHVEKDTPIIAKNIMTRFTSDIIGKLGFNW